MPFSDFGQTQQEVDQFRWRIFVILIVILCCFLSLVGRLFWLQFFRYQVYQSLAEGNRITLVPIVPNRGLIYDRNGLLLARNDVYYNLEVERNKVKDLPHTIFLLNKLVHISSAEWSHFQWLYKQNKALQFVPLRYKLSNTELAIIASHLFQFKDIVIRARQYRQYPYVSLAAHVLGYMGRITSRDISALDDADEMENYLGTDVIGQTGLEMYYEKNIHGITGFNQVVVTATGKMLNSIKEDVPIPGQNIYLTLDARLQQYAEKLFGHYRGALIAIDPRNGEILALVSQPTFDPNVFANGITVSYWNWLNQDQSKPLLNRALSGRYPPGSTYKPFLGMAALKLGFRRENEQMSDPGYFMFGSRKFRDDKEGGHGMVNLDKAITVSCDTYFYSLVNDMGVDRVHDEMIQLGFGALTGIDVPNELLGVLPSTTWKMRRFHQKWYPGETISLGVGQGYNSFTPIQMAATLSGLANHGTEMLPHVLHHFADAQHGTNDFFVPRVARVFHISNHILSFMTKAMHHVTTEGTARYAFANVLYPVAGKTGTAQVVSIGKNAKYDPKKIAKIYRDHSWFEAFAPLDHPEIAVVAIIENGGWGSQTAAPIVRKVLDFYLIGLKNSPPIQGTPDLDNIDQQVEAVVAKAYHPGSVKH